MKRYDLDGLGDDWSMHENPDGEWVRYADVEAVKMTNEEFDWAVSMSLVENPKYTIEKATAQMRLAGIHVYHCFVLDSTFHELRRCDGVDEVPSADGKSHLLMMTCNGRMRIDRDFGGNRG